MAVLCFVLGLFLLVAFFDYDPMQYAGNRSGAASVIGKEGVAVQSLSVTKENLVGPFGVYSTYWSYTILGAAAWLIPVFLLFQTYLALRSTRRFVNTRVAVMGLAIGTGAGILAMQSWVLGNRQWFPAGPGGWIGGLVYRDGLRQVFGTFGAGVLLVVTYALSMLFVFTRDIGAEFDRLIQWFQRWRERRAQLQAERADQKRLLKEQAAKQKVEAQAAAKATAAVLAETPIPVAAPLPPIGPAGKKLSIPKTQDEPLSARPGVRPPAASSESAAKTETGAFPPPEPKPNPLKLPSKTPVGEPATDTKPPAAAAAGKIELKIVAPEETRKAKTAPAKTADDDYQYPPLSLLGESAQNISADREEHEQNAQNLMRILGEFGVEVTLGEIHVGPVITRYEVVPAAGVRVEKIAGLDKNIALGMRAQSVRILAPIPGKAAVGVEVPNKKATTVGLRGILESEDWDGAKAMLPIAIGKDVSGKPLIADLTKMPHLLIAGATGSGKSVCINAIIASIVYSARPEEVRLIMVDPKIVELQIFNSLPHMLIPVVTEPKKVPAALKWLLSEMEQRYQIFAKAGVRNIAAFNALKKTAKTPPPQPAQQQAELAGVASAYDVEIPTEPLHYIVAIIDELADLMMVAPAEIETSIARLAQLTRAAGIHLIIATQRPSVNVITGVIKANLPSRIAFQVASQVDSRTILDFKGAETLIGRGDMLFSSASKLIRAQGAFVSDDEIKEIVEFLKKNGPPRYASDVQDHIDRAASEDDEDEADGEEGDLGDDEELYQQAVEVLKASRRASTSMLQRRLRIGYNRAARIMEIMEEKGIVGPENGSSPREILVDLDTL